jgi:hypothetical protein
MKTLFIFFTIAISYNIFSEDRLYVFGGGGEPSSSEKTIFDQFLKDMSSYSKSKEIKSSVYFNGGHRESDKIKSDGFSINSTKGNFTVKTYSEALQSILEDIKNNKIKSGQQILIVLETHGEDPKNDAAKKSTHYIATNETIVNGTKFSGPKVDTAELQKIIDAAALAKIKLGIIDNSCYSGNTLKLSAPNACIISSTGTNNYALASNPFKDSASSPKKDLNVFADELSGDLAVHQSKNLEELYLASRSKSIGADFPSINTEAGFKNFEALYKGLDNYLKLEAKNINMLDDVFKSLNSTESICKFDLDFNNYIQTIEKLQSDIESTSKLSRDKFSVLKNDLRSYHGLIKGLAIANIKLKKFENQTGYEFNGSPLNLREYLSIDTGLNIKKLTDNMNEELSNPGLTKEQKDITRNEYAGQINRYKKFEEERSNKIAASQELKLAFNGIQNWNKDSNKNAELALRISDDSRMVYAELYRANSKTSKNPCSEFKI